MRYFIDIEPNTKPRMTRGDKWKKRSCVLQYRAFCDELRLKTRNFKIGEAYKIIFIISMPKSWSKKKRIAMDGLAHKDTPDLDNLLKAFSDALLDQDKIIYRIEASKWWGEKGQIIVENL